MAMVGASYRTKIGCYTIEMHVRYENNERQEESGEYLRKIEKGW